MKRISLSLLFACVLATANAQDNPRITSMDLSATEIAHYMAPGWNLGNTLEAGNNANNFTNNGGLSAETSWQSATTTQALIDLLKEKGFKSVRIPCAWVMGHITDKTTMAIDNDWMQRVKDIIDYCIKDNMYVVINDHWDGGWIEYDGFTTGADVSAKKEQLRLLWTNIANALKNYDERVIFAGLNEPGVGGKSPEASGSKLSDLTTFTSRLIDYEQVFIDAVRATGGNNAKRILVVQGPNVNSADTYNYFDATKLTDSADGRLMVEFHFYDPYQFCQMESDASWGKAYYYWGTNTPGNDADHTVKANSMEKNLKTAMQNLKTKFVDAGFPVVMGEYGAIHRSMSSVTNGSQAKHDASRQYWYQFATSQAMIHGFIPFVWDNNSSSNNTMKVLDRATCTVYDQYDLDGITTGYAAGKTSYDNIYSEPSTTSGIHDVSTQAADASADVYDLQGRVVRKKVSNLNNISLPKGLYIYKGEKVTM